MYKKAIVTFLDILGFRELIKNSSTKLVNKILNHIEFSTVPKKSGESYIIEGMYFSDSVVRIRKANQKKIKNTLQDYYSMKYSTLFMHKPSSFNMIFLLEVASLTETYIQLRGAFLGQD